MTKNTTRQIPCCLALLLLSVIIGCESRSAPPVAPPSAAPLAEVQAMQPGERPKAIDDVPYYALCDFMELDPAYLEKECFCVEGEVKTVGERFGAPYVVLMSDSCDEWLDFEGGSLGRYRIPLGTNLILRGRVFYGHSLAEISIVTQAQIDKALAAEADQEGEPEQ